VEDCCRAFDICQRIDFSFAKRGVSYERTLLYELDSVLSGVVERRVLHMVTSILLSRNETMNGAGYPYGLSKKNIPLE